jgi:hypothetical protein
MYRGSSKSLAMDCRGELESRLYRFAAGRN